jgi:Flp pilus assembly CpaE family ATPase
LGHYDKVKLILNKDGDSYVKKNDMEAALGKKMDLIIPRDSKGAISAINRGIPLVMVNSHSKASKAILNYVKNNEI